MVYTRLVWRTIITRILRLRTAVLTHDCAVLSVKVKFTLSRQAQTKRDNGNITNYHWQYSTLQLFSGNTE